jgi:hypothetical protein
MAFKMNYNKSTFPFKGISSPNKFLNRMARGIGGGLAGLVSGRNKGDRGDGSGFNPVSRALEMFGRRGRSKMSGIAPQGGTNRPVNNFDPLESMYADAISKHTTPPPLSKKYKYKK